MYEFSYEHDGTLSVESAVFQALGAASTCWENMSGTGVFDSSRAKEVGEALLAFLAQTTEPFNWGMERGERTRRLEARSE